MFWGSSIFTLKIFWGSLTFSWNLDDLPSIFRKDNPHKILRIYPQNILRIFFWENQRTAKGGQRKGATSKNVKNLQKVSKIFSTFSRGAKNVKNRQKVSKIFSTLSDNFRAAPVSKIFSTFFPHGKKRQKSSKSVKNLFDTFWQFSRAAPVFRPLLGGSEKILRDSFGRSQFPTIFRSSPQKILKILDERQITHLICATKMNFRM